MTRRIFLLSYDEAITLALTPKRLSSSFHPARAQAHMKNYFR
jgi:hypothetical protein